MKAIAWATYGSTLALVSAGVVLGSIGINLGLALTDGRSSTLLLPLVAGAAGCLAGTTGVAWGASWLLIPVLFIGPCFVAMLLPEGEPLSPRWRPLYIALAAAAIVAIVASALERVFAPVLFLTALTSLIVRRLHSRGIERLQMKWLAFAVTIVALAFLTSFVIEPLIGPSWVTGGAFILGAVAVTLVPGAIIAASTLVVAALFLPVRGRVQAFVDRRFYRRRYDAQRTLVGFGTRLREQVELERLRHDLIAVVGETMQPAHTALGIRGESER
ncbi:hypothetical protein [Gaiella sp.]|uniref:hypothetical protein n=1 Tax=Gaiella sp. TaxID=2663207 RepID=UPI0032679794